MFFLWLAVALFAAALLLGSLCLIIFPSSAEDRFTNSVKLYDAASAVFEGGLKQVQD